MNSYLGLDVGSLYASAVLVDETGQATASAYRRHHGDMESALRDLWDEFAPRSAYVVRTGSGAQNAALDGDYVDAIVCGVEAAKARTPGVRNVLYVGGGSFSLARLDENGRFRHSSINSACASGTGAFLDQQATRLQIPAEELPARARDHRGQAPAVATRCAVFAKSDMIHLQQEGFGPAAIACGLCEGLGHSVVGGLLKGRSLAGKTVVIGGVALNDVVVRAIGKQLGGDAEMAAFERPELACALGAALVARQRAGGHVAPRSAGAAASRKSPAASRGFADPRQKNQETDKSALRPPLALTLSEYPDFAWHDHWTDGEGSEIAIVAPRAGRFDVSLGLDIGSTSTKAVLLDEARQVVGWVYRKTAGDPIAATQKVFRAFRELMRRGGFAARVRGVGTTGSGRRMIGELIGADLATNEITAHAAAAVFLDPEVDTIVELGGQDAKFTQLQNGMVYNSVMNYVCAAGTGSFIEEQAHKLGIPLAGYADRVMGKTCPATSDRCTVYMERDLDLLLAGGWEKDQVAAAVLHSVRDNYLNKVVGGLGIGKRVYFQGATARNKGLVAAFEMELGQSIRVSPYCHLTGALGMALLAQGRVPEAERSRRFKGLDFADAPVTVDTETCRVCHNRCRLSLIRAGRGEPLAWGLKCGRDYSEAKVKVRKTPGYEAWKRREAAWNRRVEIAAPSTAALAERRAERPRVGLARGLGLYGYWPYWQAFFAALGCEPVLSPATREKTLRRGTEISAAEYCAPVLAALGHARALVEESKVDYIFAPHLIREPTPAGFAGSHFCPYVQSHPSALAALPQLLPAGRLLSPVIDWTQSPGQVAGHLRQALGRTLDADKNAIRRALRAASAAQETFQAAARQAGDDTLATLEKDNALAIVCLGRPYNTTDPGMTLDLPRKTAELGYTVLYQDMLPSDMSAILPRQRLMYWHYGQKVRAAAEYVAKHPRLFAVYYTNFMCGPDSYIMTHFKDIMGRAGKPYLCLQLDGHGADAGYLTRMEAALESFHAWSRIPRPVG